MKIEVFEHQTLRVNEQFKPEHFAACVKFNELHGNEYFDVLHQGLRFKHFVGALQIDDLLIQIHPKADRNSDNNEWRNVLLRMLKTCGHITADTLDNANLKHQHFSLLDLYFDYYLRELEQLLHRGLVKRYRKHSGNVKALKGKLEFAQHIRHNLVHQERFYTTHQVYDVDHRLHQVLGHALDIVQQFTRGTSLSDKCGRVRLNFPEVSKIRPNEAILEQLVLDRKTQPYARALELAKLIILNYSPDIQQGNNKMISLLFNMNELWEEFILVCLRRYLYENQSNWEVQGQESKRFHGYRTIRPDLVLTNKLDAQKKIVLDTKWKLPKDNKASVEDLRQMYTYGRFWQAEKMILLYPGENDLGQFKAYDNILHDITNHQCKVAKVSLLEQSENWTFEIGKAVFELCELNQH